MTSGFALVDAIFDRPRTLVAASQRGTLRLLQLAEGERPRPSAQRQSLCSMTALSAGWSGLSVSGATAGVRLGFAVAIEKYLAHIPGAVLADNVEAGHAPGRSCRVGIANPYVQLPPSEAIKNRPPVRATLVNREAKTGRLPRGDNRARHRSGR